jgi:hypothetical protein
MKNFMRFALRILRGPAVVIAIYSLLHILFGILTEDGGLLTPGGSVNLGIASLGCVVLLLRLVVVFVVPVMISYRAVSAIMRGEFI